MHLCIVQRHLRFFISIFIMHIMDDIHGVDIGFGKPWAVNVHQLQHLVVFEIFPLIGLMLRPNLEPCFFILAAVEAHKQQLCKIGPRAEELHLLADLHGGYAAGNRIIVAVDRAHQVVVFILDRIRIAGNLRSKPLKRIRQAAGP